MRSSKILILWILALLLWPGSHAAVGADEVTERIEKPVRNAITTRQATQEEEEQWRAQREQLMARYEALEQTIAQLDTHKAALQQSNDDTRRRIAAKAQQLADIEQIGAGISPLVEEVIGQLQTFVASGLPFLSAERQARIERLSQLSNDPDIAVSEKFRKVMEALTIEAEYGNTIEVHQETITAEDQEMLVHVFRLGRMSLFFQTLDHHQCGVFNVATSRWEPLPRDYNAAIETAIDIGAKRQPVELLNLPVGRMAIP